MANPRHSDDDDSVSTSPRLPSWFTGASPNQRPGKREISDEARPIEEEIRLSVTHLILWNRDVGAREAETIANALYDPACTLEMIDLRGNRIADEGCRVIADALCSNATVTEVNLSENGVGDDGATALAETLRVNKAITTLHLYDNDIDQDGVAAIADALLTNRSITELNIGGNNIADRGAEVLANALCRNQSVQTLLLWRGGIHDGGINAIAEALRQNRSITTLNLSENFMTVDAAKVLADALRRNHTVADIKLPRQHVGDNEHHHHGSETNLELERRDIFAQLSADVETLLVRNKMMLCHKRALKSKGPRWYIKIRTSSPRGNQPELQIQWSSRVWECEIGDGTAFSLVEKTLQQILSGKGENTIVSEWSQPSDDLITVCQGEALTDLVNSCSGPNGSNLLHLAAKKESSEALSLCKFLVEKLNADFDTQTDGKGRTARTIALANPNPQMQKWARTAGTIFGRYLIEGWPNAIPEHKSATCTVYFATDVTIPDKRHDHRRVAIKIMYNPDHFRRSLDIRLNHPDRIASGSDIAKFDNKFDGDHVVPILRNHDEEINGKRWRCLVMPMAERSLVHIIGVERIAGHDLDKVQAFGRDIAKALHHLHNEHGVIHADFKPRNIVRIHGDYKLIDFDAAVRKGQGPTNKASTAYIPPELGRIKLRPEENESELRSALTTLILDFEAKRARCDFEELQILMEKITATKSRLKQLEGATSQTFVVSPTFDVWSFGVTMFYMFTGSSLFKCDQDDNLAGSDEEQRLVNWNGLSTQDLSLVFRDQTPQVRKAAQSLLRECLEPNPSRRMQNMKEVLDHFFFKSDFSDLSQNIAQMNMTLDLIHQDTQALRQGQKLAAEYSAATTQMMLSLSALDFSVPRMVVVLPEAFFEARDKRDVQGLFRSLKRHASEAQEMLGLIERWRIIPVCEGPFLDVIQENANVEACSKSPPPVSYSVKTDGSNTRAVKGAIIKAAPAIRFVLETLRLASMMSAFFGVPLANIVPDWDRLGIEENDLMFVLKGVSALLEGSMEKFEDALNEVDGCNDSEDDIQGAIGEALDAVEGYAGDSTVLSDSLVSGEPSAVFGEAYEAVRQLLEEERWDETTHLSRLHALDVPDGRAVVWLCHHCRDAALNVKNEAGQPRFVETDIQLRAHTIAEGTRRDTGQEPKNKLFGNIHKLCHRPLKRIKWEERNFYVVNGSLYHPRPGHNPVKKISLKGAKVSEATLRNSPQKHSSYNVTIPLRQGLDGMDDDKVCTYAIKKNDVEKWVISLQEHIDWANKHNV